MLRKGRLKDSTVIYWSSWNILGLGCLVKVNTQIPALSIEWTPLCSLLFYLSLRLLSLPHQRVSSYSIYSSFWLVAQWQTGFPFAVRCPFFGGKKWSLWQTDQHSESECNQYLLQNDKLRRSYYEFGVFVFLLLNYLACVCMQKVCKVKVASFKSLCYKNIYILLHLF